MSFLFSKTKMPATQTVSMPSVPETKDYETTKKEEKAKLTKGMAKRSTLLTSPRGVLTEAPVMRKSLLGE